MEPKQKMDIIKTLTERVIPQHYKVGIVEENVVPGNKYDSWMLCFFSGYTIIGMIYVEVMTGHDEVFFYHNEKEHSDFVTATEKCLKENKITFKSIGFDNLLKKLTHN